MVVGGSTLAKPSISDRALTCLYAGRKPKENVNRTKTGKSQGKSRGEIEEIHPESLAVRDRMLASLGLPLTRTKIENGREVTQRTAAHALSGYSLGQLYLRHQTNNQDPGSINRDQFEAGESWCRIVHRHAAIMGYRLSTTPTSIVMLGGGATAKEPDEEQIAKIRGQFRDCYNALQSVSRVHGWRLSEVCYGIAVENWPLQRLTEDDYGALRIGLNSLGKVLG